MKNIYRKIVIIALFLNTLIWGLPYVDYLWLSPEALRLLEWDGYKAYLTSSNLFYWVFFSLWIMSLVGLYFYNSLARKAFLILLVTSVVVAPLWGYRVSTPVETMIFYVMALMYGFIIAVIYLTDVSKEFRKDHAKNI